MLLICVTSNSFPMPLVVEMANANSITYTKKVTVPAYTIVTLKTTTEYETSDNTISTVVDGKLYTIPNVKIKKVVKTVVDPVFTSTEHGHGHGHGNGNNAGGGDGATE